tara:strand:+ start:184 stop:597 length:414 start_codon:yes stop_codon:yes gene_type:complete
MKHILEELNSIIENGLEHVTFPYKKGNSIRIKNYIVRQNNQGMHLVYDCLTNLRIVEVYFKTTAIAIAKNLAEGKDITQKAVEIDFDLLKHYNDALFFKNTIKTSKDSQIRQVRINRLDLSLDKSKQLKKDLDRFIF